MCVLEDEKPPSGRSDKREGKMSWRVRTDFERCVKNYGLHPELGFLAIFCAMDPFGSWMKPMNSFKE